MGACKRILAIDDDERVLFVLRRTLMRVRNGYEIVTARNSREALDEINARPFDLVITDLRMPGMDGVGLTEKIRALSSDTVVIWITAYGCHTVEAAAARLSVYRCLEKPLKVDEIRHVAREALEKRGVRYIPDHALAENARRRTEMSVRTPDDLVGAEWSEATCRRRTT